MDNAVLKGDGGAAPPTVALGPAEIDACSVISVAVAAVGLYWIRHFRPLLIGAVGSLVVPPLTLCPTGPCDGRHDLSERGPAKPAKHGGCSGIGPRPLGCRLRIAGVMAMPSWFVQTTSRNCPQFSSRISRLAGLLGLVGLAIASLGLVSWTAPADAQTSAYAYVANYYANTVSVIDTSTNSVVATVPVGSAPAQVAATPDGSYVYVTNFGSGTVSVIATATNTVVATVSNVPAWAVATMPNGRGIYVADNGADVINTASDAVVATVSCSSRKGRCVAPYSDAVAVTPNSQYAYVSHYTSNNLEVINTTTNAVIKSVKVGNAPLSLAVTPNGADVYVANGRSGTVSVVKTSKNRVVKTIKIGGVPEGLAISPSGGYAYVTNYDSPSEWPPAPGQGQSYVSVINTATNQRVATVSVGDVPGWVAFTSNGSFAYVTNFDSNSVSVISTATNTVIATIPVGASPFGVAIANF